MKNILFITLFNLAVHIQAQSLLVFSKTNGYRHASIPAGQQALKQIADQEDFEVTFTEDSTLFTRKNLKKYDLIIFLQTTGDILNENQQQAFEKFILKGGHFVGIHSASDTEFEWEWFGNLIGNYFESHPAQQTATIINLAAEHPINSMIPTQWIHYDEWYNFRKPFSKEFTYLLAVDESTYEGGIHPKNHPIAWCREFGKSRVFYTALGHTSEAYADTTYLTHLKNGILWTLRK